MKYRRYYCEFCNTLTDKSSFDICETCNEQHQQLHGIYHAILKRKPELSHLPIHIVIGMLWQSWERDHPLKESNGKAE